MIQCSRRRLLGMSVAFGVVLGAGPLLGQQVYKEIHELQPGEFT